MTKAAATVRQAGGTGAAAEFERLYRANVEAVTAYFARRSADPLVIGVATSGNTSYGIGTLASPPAPSCVAQPPLPPGSGGSGTIGGSGS